MRDSAFLRWFEAQHGKRCSWNQAEDKQLREQVEAGKAAEAELRRRADWDRMKHSALYAWNVSDADKRST